MALDHSRRRIRFYKPLSNEVSAGKEEPQSIIPPSKTLAQRFAEAQPTVPQQHRIVDVISSSSTPVSRTTPETLRTLELNWRERRRAKLEDITLQRAMGVEARTPHAQTRESVDVEEADGELQDAAEPASNETRRKRISPTAPAKSVITSSDKLPAPPSGFSATPREPRPLQPIPVNRMSSASLARPSIAYTANNTTYQTRTNRARKIVKLVRDARHSVHANGIESKVDPPRDDKKDFLELPEKQLPESRKHKETTEASTTTQPPRAACAKPMVEETYGPTTSAVPRRVSEIRKVPKRPTEERCQSSPQHSLRSPFPESPSQRTPMDTLQPITASPLPSREYPLTATSSLIIYPYGQDWSINIGSDDRTSSPTKPSRRRHPVMSAVTASERMDILDEGMTMRIKPPRSSVVGSRQSRYLELQHAARWDSSDRRRWVILTDLVERLKAKTRRSTTDFPQGSLHVMCNDPPDIVFYTTIVEPPPLSAKTSTKGDLGEATCDTSALLSATTDIFYLCRSRIIYSPSRGTLKLSTRYGPSSSEKLDGYGTRSPSTKNLPPTHSRQTFRTRRIINLSATASTSIQNQVLELYKQQKAALVPNQAPDLQSNRKRTPVDFPQEVWQAHEVQSLGRFLKVEDLWAMPT